MPDPLGELLRAEADRLVADEQIPPVDGLRERRGRPSATRLLAPALAAAAVVGLVLGVQQVTGYQAGDEPAVRPSPAALVRIVPPTVVRTRLGAPSGHVNGPAVAAADQQAASAPGPGGLVLRTVAAARPSRRIDPQGEPLVDRCRYTYSDPGLRVLHGRCDWGVNLLVERPPGGVTVEQRRASGRPYLLGTAPRGTAGVVLRSPGRPQVLVPVADPGPDWADRPAWVAWTSSRVTDVVALDRDGRELARVHVPSDVPVRTSPDDPQLGTVEVPLIVRERVERSVPSAAQGGGREVHIVGKRADVLVRVDLGGGLVLSTYGVRTTDRSSCVVDVSTAADGSQPASGSTSCGPSRVQPGQQRIEAGRSYSAGTGAPGEQTINGTAPAGTVRVRLHAAGSPGREVPAFGSGPRWGSRAYFAADWPSRPHTTVSALAADGRVLGTVVVRGLDPHSFDADVLERVAACLTRQGVQVVRHPQPAGGPAYEYRYGAVGPVRGQRLTDTCEDEALGAR